jgi:uncharacterized membrane protein required for colicin V production
MLATVDYIFIVIIILCCLAGFSRGVVRTLLSLGSLVIAWFGATTLAPFMITYCTDQGVIANIENFIVEKYTDMAGNPLEIFGEIPVLQEAFTQGTYVVSKYIFQWIILIVLFVLFMILLSIGVGILDKALEDTPLGVVNRVLGGAAGLGTGLVSVAVLANILSLLAFLFALPWLTEMMTNSFFGPYFIINFWS